MTTEREVSPEKSLAPASLPWLVAAGALVIYLVTLNRWVSLSSLQQVARISGWTWQPELYGPLFWLVTYPFRWLPAQLIPVALNLFAAVCAALSLALLARSVALLPHDRTEDQRQQESSISGLLSIRTAWLPPVLAALVCGLQLTFWEYATAISSPPLPPAMPWGAGCEMLDLLLFAYVVRCLLEYRVEDRESWLLRAAFTCGVGMTNNWAMIGFFPAFMVALVWIKGLSFFDLRFLGRMCVCGLAGLMLYLLLPLLHGATAASTVGFWSALKANLNEQKAILSLFYHNGRQVLELLALTSLLPVFFMGIRWSAGSGDVNKSSITLTRYLFHLVHALFLVACIWVALDPPFSPRNKGLGSPFLTFYYLGALTVGYCSGYFLLIFRQRRRSRRPQPPPSLLANKLVTGAVWLVLFAAPLALICRNLPQIRVTNGPMLKRYCELVAQAIPAQDAVLLSDDFGRSLLLQAYAAVSGKGNDNLILNTSALYWSDYHRFLKIKYPKVWESDPPKDIMVRADPLLLAQLISRLAQRNTIYYLHPSFGYYFELFYPEPHGLVYKLSPYPTNALFAPPLSKDLIVENETFWAAANDQALRPLLAAVAARSAGKQTGIWDRLMEYAHLVRESNRDAIALAEFYSRALDYWGVEMQRSIPLADTNALTRVAPYFERALELNPDNVVAHINLECNEKLRAGKGKTSVQVTKSIGDQFGRYRSWDEVVGANGPFDEPNFCYEEGRTLAGNSNWRQAAAQFDRAMTLDHENLGARLWLAQVYVLLQRPSEALKLVEQIHAQPDLLDAARTNRTDLLFVETSAHLAQGNLRGAEGTVEAMVRQYPGDVDLLATATQVYMKYGRYFDEQSASKSGLEAAADKNMKHGCYSNALIIIDQQLTISPTNMDALVNKGYASIQVGAFEQAIPPLSKVLALQSTNYSALLNRAICYLGANKLEGAQRDYEALQKAFPSAFPIYYGLAEIAWRSKDTNAAIHNYELYLANAPTNTTEAKLVSERLKELTPGSP
jgi:tetratricopeptide (TPR) repeat protein